MEEDEGPWAPETKAWLTMLRWDLMARDFTHKSFPKEEDVEGNNGFLGWRDWDLFNYFCFMFTTVISIALLLSVVISGARHLMSPYDPPPPRCKTCGHLLEDPK